MINLGAGIARYLLNGHAVLSTGCGGDVEAKGPANMKPSALSEPDLLVDTKRNLHMAVVAADHDRSNHYWELLEYASEQEAMKTAELPETKAAYEKWSRLLAGEPTFHNLDVVEHVGAPEGPVECLGPWTTPSAG